MDSFSKLLRRCHNITLRQKQKTKQHARFWKMFNMTALTVRTSASQERKLRPPQILRHSLKTP